MKFGSFILSICLLPTLSISLIIPSNSQLSAKGRSQVWVQTFATPNGQQLNLLELLNRQTRVTHIYLASVHLNNPPGNIHLNDAPPDDQRFDYVWPQIRVLQQNGVKVLMLLGGAAQGSYWRLSGSDEEFETYYLPLLAILRRYSIDGLDLDIEEEVDVSVPLRLLRRLDADMGPNFILTMAPVASAMLPQPWGAGLSGFDYRELDDKAVSSNRPGGKLVNWYNCQFYNGWGDASSARYYNAIKSLGKWEPSRIVMGVLANPGNGGSGYVSMSRLTETIHQLRSNYPDFGGIIGWEYFNAGGSEKVTEPALWVKAMSNALYDPYTPRRINFLTSVVPEIPSQWPEALNTLRGEGSSYFEAVKALNVTNGDLAQAESILFPPSA
ncbi:hypothetical protein H072_7463 [Dactylellina haptotyla CBS 200.50]|uniref:chitinase n=1 Tax=Dactylellina haptotyla (strain CBS 200.50) TaxID=1284197 RepID=S8A7E6_DACHA|nr:hypothetical protein H072_7463 [Dactylellina haptotyla CBS 200.50]